MRGRNRRGIVQVEYSMEASGKVEWFQLNIIKMNTGFRFLV